MPTTSALRPCSTGRAASSVMAVLRSAGEDARGVARDHQLLVGGDDPRRYRALRRRYARAVRAVRGAVELDAEPRGIAADALAQAPAVLADARGEDDRVEPAERGGERAQLAPDAVDEEVDRRLGRRVAARLERAHVARDAGDAEQARLLVDQLLDRARVHLHLVDEVEH